MTDEARKKTGQVVAGVVVLLLGVALFFDQLGSIRFYEIGRLWPLIVVAVGVSRLLGADGRQTRRRALVVLFIGVWLFIANMALFGLDWEHSWPLALVAVGLASLIAGIRRRRIHGAFLILLGGWMLAIVQNYRGLTWDNAWPLMMVTAGIYIVTTALLPRSRHGMCCDCEECCP